MFALLALENNSQGIIYSNSINNKFDDNAGYTLQSDPVEISSHSSMKWIQGYKTETWHDPICKVQMKGSSKIQAYFIYKLISVTHFLNFQISQKYS